MAVLSQKSAYAIAEVFRVQSEGTTPVAIMKPLAGFVISLVLVRIETPGTGAANLMVGDAGDADGLLLPADTTAAIGALYGDVVTERGAYLYDSIAKAGSVKMYPAGETISLVLSAAGTTQGVYQVLVIGHRYDV